MSLCICQLLPLVMLQNKSSLTLVAQPQTFSHTLLHLQVTDHGSSDPELVDRLSSVPLLEAVGHTLGFTRQDTEGHHPSVEGQQLLRETLCSPHSVQGQLCPH